MPCIPPVYFVAFCLLNEYILLIKKKKKKKKNLI